MKVPSAAAALLAANNLHLWRGERHVLRGTSFSLNSGQALQVWGANGAGKTSLLRVICGLLPPEEGEVFWQGQPTRVAGAEFLAALGYLGHDNALKGDLTALENLRFAVGLKRPIEDEQLQSALADLGVQDCAHLPCRVLSAGQRRRVALCRLFLSGARLWVLDEPYTNLDAASSERVSQALAAHLDGGGLALVAAHQGLNLPGRAVGRLELS